MLITVLKLHPVLPAPHSCVLPEQSQPVNVPVTPPGKNVCEHVYGSL